MVLVNGEVSREQWQLTGRLMSLLECLERVHSAVTATDRGEAIEREVVGLRKTLAEIER